LPEASSSNITSGLENSNNTVTLDNGGLDFSFDGLTQGQGDGQQGQTGENNVEEQNRQQQQQQQTDDFWGDLQVDGDTGLGDEFQVDNSFADLVDFDELGMPEGDTGAGDGEYDWLTADP